MTRVRLGILIAALYAVTMAVLLLSCAHPLEPEPVLPRHEQLYAEVVSCAGLAPRPMPKVYIVPASEMPCCIGAWTPGGIYLADSPEGRSTFTIRHELLHHLLQGDAGHQHEAWKSCGLQPDAQPIVLQLQ